jgi:hemerythrin-like metal-binding protein
VLLLYVESTPTERLRVDKGLQDLLAQHMAATYDHLNAVEQVRRAHRAAVTALSDLAEFKDTETGEHVLRVARMTDEIAWVLRENGHFPEQLTDSFLEQVGTAAILHDVGKVAIPDRILLKPGSLDAEERRYMQAHTTQGGAILAKARNLAKESLYLALATEIAESHHEQYDGGGYPRGLKGDQIPLAARIVAVVDVFDALSSKRPYKEPWPLEKVLTYIRDGAGSQFDPRVAEAFLTVMERRSMVGLLEWTPSMSVGEAALDDDHRHLLQLLNQVTTAQVLGNRAIVEYVLDELHFYIQEHFQREERHMEAMAFPQLDAHRKIHRSYSEKIAQIRWQFLRGLRGELSEELLSLLSNWLTEHIMGVDKAYKVFQEQQLQRDPT